MLYDAPYDFDIIAGMPPIAFGLKVSKIERIFEAIFYTRGGASDFPRHECFAAHWALVIKQNAICGMNTIGFAVIDGDPIGIEFGRRVGAARIKRCRF